MKKLSITLVILLVVVFGGYRLSPAHAAKATGTLPLPDQPVATDMPSAHELPDPKIDYKIVFDIAKASEKIGDVNPGLTFIARYYNTLARYGVPADHRKFVVVFHQGGTDMVMNNDTFQSRNDGHDNPNIALIREMKKAGIDFRVCGQALLSEKIDPETVQHEIQVDLWAMTTIVNFEMRGYIHHAA